MQIENKEVIIRMLTPEVGHWLTNGESYSKLVYLGTEADPSVWQEITQAEYEARQQELEDWRIKNE